MCQSCGWIRPAITVMVILTVHNAAQQTWHWAIIANAKMPWLTTRVQECHVRRTVYRGEGTEQVETPTQPPLF